MHVPSGAFWIGSDHPFDLQEAYVDFNRTLTIIRRPRTARLFITADSRYRLWINGIFVTRGPSRGWPWAQQVDELDVTPFLRDGENTVAVQVYSPGYSHFAAVHRGASGFIAWLTGNGRVLCVTDSEWQAARDVSWRSDVARVSIYGAGVERRDLRRGPGAAGTNARIVAPAESPLWPKLVARDVPLLDERVTALTAPWQRRSGPWPEADDPHEALREIMGQVRDDGPAQIWVFDLGASCICQGIAGVRDAKGGERLLISYAEKLRGGEVLLSDPSTYCRMRMTDEFILRPGAQTVEGFSLRGARYLIFALCAPHGERLDISFSVRRSIYPLDEKPLRLRDAALQPIAALCHRTLLACLQDGFVDSVWRESSQWLGDGVAQAFALAAISDDHRPLRRLITMAAQGADDDGILPSVLPGEVHAYTITDYNFSWIELLALYRGPDRAELLDAMRPVAARMLDRFEQDLGLDGLIRSQPGRRLFLDWSGVDRREPNLTYNARYLHALQIAELLGFATRAAALREAIIAAFRINGAWCESREGTPASQLGLALALLTGCAAPELADAVVAGSLAADGALVLASPFMQHYVCLALHKLGRDGDIRAIIRARWGRWADAGEPTCWENWNVDFPDGSTCHGYSAHPLGWLALLD